MMASRIQDAHAVNAIARNQLKAFHASGSLQQAAKSWYEGLDDEKKRLVETTAQDIVGVMHERCPTPFGFGSALELIAALIAFQEGWLEIDACKAYRLRMKYERKTRRLQLGD